jgi:hypothetical protein
MQQTATRPWRVVLFCRPFGPFPFHITASRPKSIDIIEDLLLPDKAPLEDGEAVHYADFD